ncbi:hypothetical protein U0070_004145, partial [Myodes glareolus]
MKKENKNDITALDHNGVLFEMSTIQPEYLLSHTKANGDSTKEIEQNNDRVEEKEEGTKSSVLKVIGWLHRPSLKPHSEGSSEKPNLSLIKEREADDIMTKGRFHMEVEIEDIFPQVEELARDLRKEPPWQQEPLKNNFNPSSPRKDVCKLHQNDSGLSGRLLRLDRWQQLARLSFRRRLEKTVNGESLNRGDGEQGDSEWGDSKQETVNWGGGSEWGDSELGDSEQETVNGETVNGET